MVGTVGDHVPVSYTHLDVYKRQLLHSLFRDILQKEHIEVETAIRCIRNGRVINSSTDSLFYKKASSLKPIVYRIDENKERNITLQAYVRCV